MAFSFNLITVGGNNKINTNRHKGGGRGYKPCRLNKRVKNLVSKVAKYMKFNLQNKVPLICSKLLNGFGNVLTFN